MIAAARTWGLTNVEFDVLYTCLCALYAITAIRWRRALRTSRPAAAAGHDLPAVSAGMLVAGTYGAVLAATAALLSRGVLVAGADGKPVVSPRAQSTTDAVERAVADLVRASPGIRVHRMYRRLRRDRSIQRLASQLVADGMLARPQDVRRMRRLLPIGLLLAALGVARIVGVDLHVDDGKPPFDNLGIVSWLLMVAVFGYALSLLFEWPGATPAGDEALAVLRERHPQPDAAPVAATQLAHVVALHGPAAIAVNHPELSSWVDEEVTWRAQRR